MPEILLWRIAAYEADIELVKWWNNQQGAIVALDTINADYFQTHAFLALVEAAWEKSRKPLSVLDASRMLAAVCHMPEDLVARLADGRAGHSEVQAWHQEQLELVQMGKHPDKEIQANYDRDRGKSAVQVDRELEARLRGSRSKP